MALWYYNQVKSSFLKNVSFKIAYTYSWKYHISVKLNLEELLTHFYKFTILALIIKNTNNRITGAFPKNSNKHKVAFVQYFQRATQTSTGNTGEQESAHTSSQLGKVFLCKLMLRPLNRKTTLKITHTFNSYQWNNSYCLFQNQLTIDTIHV